MQENNLSLPVHGQNLSRLSALATAVCLVATYQGTAQAAPLVIQPGSNASYTFIPAPVGPAPSPAPTPTPPPPSPAPCTANAAAVINWSSGASSCTADSQTTPTGTSVASGSSITYTDNGAPTTGSNIMTCSNGVWASSGATCTTASPPPPAQCTVPNYSGQTWSQGASSCSSDSQSHGAGSAIASGSSVSLTDSGAPTTGSAAMLCTNGSFSLSSATCSTAASPPPAPECPTSYSSMSVTGTTSGAVWGSGPYTDDSNLGAAAVHLGILAVGQTAVINKTAISQFKTPSFAGSYRNGVTSASYGAFCGMNISNAGGSPPPSPPASCTVPNYFNQSWSQGASTCNSSSQNASAGSSIGSGSSVILTDSNTPTTGSASYLCTNGSFSLSSASCSTAAPPPAASCTVPDGVGAGASWSLSGSTCAANAQSLPKNTSVVSGGTFTYTDNVAPTTGTETQVCNNGIWSSQSRTCAAEAFNTTFAWLIGNWQNGGATAIQNTSNGSVITGSLPNNMIDEWYANMTTSVQSATANAVVGGRDWMSGYSTAGNPASFPAMENRTVCLATRAFGTYQIQNHVFKYENGKCDLRLFGAGQVDVNFADAGGRYFFTNIIQRRRDRYTASATLSASQSSPNSASWNATWISYDAGSGAFTNSGTATATFSKTHANGGTATLTIIRGSGSNLNFTLTK